MDNNKAMASPGPAGHMVLAFYLAGLWPVSTGLCGNEGTFLLIPLGFAGAIIQLTSGIINLKNREILSGNMMMAFSAFMWLGCITNLLKYLGVAPASGYEFGDGLVTLVMGIYMVGFTGYFLKQGVISGLFMVTTDIFFIFSGLGMLTGIQLFRLIGGWMAPIIICTLILSVLAEVHTRYESTKSVSSVRELEIKSVS